MVRGNLFCNHIADYLENKISETLRTGSWRDIFAMQESREPHKNFLHTNTCKS